MPAEEKGRKRGRPPSQHPLMSYVRFRCLPSEKEAWFAAAGGQRKFSDWARKVLNREAGQ